MMNNKSIKENIIYAPFDNLKDQEKAENDIKNEIEHDDTILKKEAAQTENSIIDILRG